jgi:hypothetical protein
MAAQKRGKGNDIFLAIAAHDIGNYGNADNRPATATGQNLFKIAAQGLGLEFTDVEEVIPVRQTDRREVGEIDCIFVIHDTCADPATDLSSSSAPAIPMDLKTGKFFLCQS